jgi:hypothetical protein
MDLAGFLPQNGAFPGGNPNRIGSKTVHWSLDLAHVTNISSHGTFRSDLQKHLPFPDESRGVHRFTEVTQNLCQ